jgi:hypothetical protein
MAKDAADRGTQHRLVGCFASLGQASHTLVLQACKVTGGKPAASLALSSSDGKTSGPEITLGAQQVCSNQDTVLLPQPARQDVLQWAVCMVNLHAHPAALALLIFCASLRSTCVVHAV